MADTVPTQEDVERAAARILEKGERYPRLADMWEEMPEGYDPENPEATEE